MKRYWLFVGDFYYPVGGMLDFVRSFDSALEAEKVAYKVECEWFQVVDSQTGEIVAQGEK